MSGSEGANTTPRRSRSLASALRVAAGVGAAMLAVLPSPSDALNVDRFSRASELSAVEMPLNVTNPWAEVLQRYNVPLVHGSGVYVDLGNNKLFKGKSYREPSGKCPNIGKYIETYQPTKNPAVWPNNYLAPVPFANSEQDTKPLGGGFSMPIPMISPKKLSELKELAASVHRNPEASAYAKEYVKQIKDDLGYCIWWARMTSAHDEDAKPTAAKESLYRYAYAWDGANETCHLLYLNMQEMKGAGTYCKKGDEGTDLTWYCFSPAKKIDNNLVWGSAYTRLDHAAECPQHGLKDAHWGQWNGRSCQKMAVRKRVAVKDAAECALKLFQSSPSDNPTKYVGDEGRGWGKIYDNIVGVLFPAGASGQDQPHSRGVGLNWANYYNTKRTGSVCEMYDGAPDCLTQAPRQYAFVSLGDPNPEKAQLPPCAATLRGVSIDPSTCSCPAGSETGTGQGQICSEEGWQQQDIQCTCNEDNAEDGVNPWLIAGPCIAVGVLLLAGGAYWLAKKNTKEPVVEAPNIEEESTERTTQQHKQRGDLLQEAEPSFWGETEEDSTNVILEGDEIDRDF
ncbi:apical membrane antigen 1 domain-containing protein [Besnoitia besnoiti]|uniref:Apical membrane antigen 1 domain-containing protein n=1 Tax=Besnoitia besnoiti TaxID=94643 RepID=A0A2A9MMH6_BESBE|nr:apical membrane antigen 1 domain-containing protein [Besnoitia besnoiti]PFH37631.1 apical membrane antigen 1 domain-containing protein [Besnoitia besnoiti]